jgi:uncharacterized membrane protein YphA (DoxX/SURF4 family)
MRWLFAAVLILHGLLHFMGPAKAFGWAELSQLQMPISRTAGVAWGCAGVALLATAALYLIGLRAWWVLALVSIVLSQVVIMGSWSDARVGTVANLLILGFVLATILGRGEVNPG